MRHYCNHIVMKTEGWNLWWEVAENHHRIPGVYPVGDVSVSCFPYTEGTFRWAMVRGWCVSWTRKENAFTIKCILITIPVAVSTLDNFIFFPELSKPFPIYQPALWIYCCNAHISILDNLIWQGRYLDMCSLFIEASSQHSKAKEDGAVVLESRS